MSSNGINGGWAPLATIGDQYPYLDYPYGYNLPNDTPKNSAGPMYYRSDYSVSDGYAMPDLPSETPMERARRLFASTLGAIFARLGPAPIALLRADEITRMSRAIKKSALRMELDGDYRGAIGAYERIARLYEGVVPVLPMTAGVDDFRSSSFDLRGDNINRPMALHNIAQARRDALEIAMRNGLEGETERLAADYRAASAAYSREYLAVACPLLKEKIDKALEAPVVDGGAAESERWLDEYASRPDIAIMNGVPSYMRGILEGCRMLFDLYGAEREPLIAEIMAESMLAMFSEKRADNTIAEVEARADLFRNARDPRMAEALFALTARPSYEARFGGIGMGMLILTDEFIAAARGENSPELEEHLFRLAADDDLRVARLAGRFGYYILHTHHGDEEERARSLLLGFVDASMDHNGDQTFVRLMGGVVERMWNEYRDRINCVTFGGLFGGSVGNCRFSDRGLEGRDASFFDPLDNIARLLDNPASYRGALAEMSAYTKMRFDGRDARGAEPPSTSQPSARSEASDEAVEVPSDGSVELGADETANLSNTVGIMPASNVLTWRI